MKLGINKIFGHSKTVLGFFVLFVLILNLNCSKGAKVYERSKQAGIEFGKSTDQNGCLKEALARSEEVSFYQMYKHGEVRGFFRGCLEGSQPVEGFCDDVPGKLDLKESDWEREKCRGAKGLLACRGVFSEQHKFCRF